MTTSLTPSRSSAGTPARTAAMAETADTAATAATHVGRRRLLSHPVVLAATGLVLLQLGFRAWATYTSWFTGDDFYFIAHMTTDGTSLASALEPHGGHLMPAGMYLSWLSDAISPYDYWFNATVLLLLQVAADVGLLVLLVKLFGPRPGILPPLALYLFTVFTAPLAVWWAAGINQFALHIALFWGLIGVVSYLRTRRPAGLWAAAAVTVGGLLFYEKTILVVGVFGIVAMAYFASGGLWQRLRHVLTTYRLGVVVLGGLAVAYGVAYAVLGLNFNPGKGGNEAFGQVAVNMVVQSGATGLVGGPFAWTHVEPGSLPDPSNLVVLAALVVIVVVVLQIHRSRRRSLRGWLVPAYFLVADAALVTAARASLVGPRIALDYRYEAELGAAAALGLALATLPLLGAVETVEPRPGGRLLGHPRRVAALTTVVAVLGAVSTVQYVTRWQDDLKGQAFFDRLLPALDRTTGPVPLVDRPVPAYIVSPLEYPGNQLSHLLVSYAGHASFPDQATDTLLTAADDGRLVPVYIPPTRAAPPGPQPGCGYAITGDEVSIPLNGQVSFGGHWVRIGYLASASSPVVVTAGQASYSTVVQPGVHALYLAAGSDFDSVEISGLASGVTMCTDDVTVGVPKPTTGTGVP
jgi:hypothetical protein